MYMMYVKYTALTGGQVHLLAAGCRAQLVHPSRRWQRLQELSKRFEIQASPPALDDLDLHEYGPELQRLR